MNVQLCYFGGSGGFFALWHILLGTEYNCVLTNTNQAYEDIKGESWPAISDLPATIRELPNEIQEELVFPGQIKVNLIRSVDAVQYANKQSK